MTPETKLKKKFKDMMLRANPGIFLISLSERYTSGIPDMMAIQEGKVSFYEIKSNHGRVTPTQIVQMQRLTKAGASCYIVKGTVFEFDIIPFEEFKKTTRRKDGGTNIS